MGDNKTKEYQSQKEMMGSSVLPFSFYTKGGI
jgi:hypothetical protein